jgi:cytochrome b6-f complex iron-sulfur subunit
MNRRTALKSFAFVPLGVSIAGLAAMGLRFISPVSKERMLRVFALHLDDIPIGKTKRFKDLQGKDLLIVRTGENEVKALSTVCTHLGCTVYWQQDKNRFFCPCHDGVFDPDGNVTAGPPPRKLDSYDVEVDGKSVFIYFKAREA